jgi:hypothetical protein
MIVLTTGAGALGGYLVTGTGRGAALGAALGAGGLILAAVVLGSSSPPAPTSLAARAGAGTPIAGPATGYGTRAPTLDLSVAAAIERERIMRDAIDAG